MRLKREWRSASREVYEKFLAETKIDITFKQYKEILYRFNQLLIDLILETGDKIKLPYGFGYIAITKYKPNPTRKGVNGQEVRTAPIDWVASREEGRTVRSANIHTNGYKFYFYWNQHFARMKFAVIWSLKVHRNHSRKLAKLLKQENSYQYRYHQWLTRK